MTPRPVLVDVNRPVAAVTHIADRRAPWDRMTPTDQKDHIDSCRTLCDLCDGHRAFGVCTTCGGDAEETGVFDLSRCCGSAVAFPGPEDDHPRAA